MVQYGEALRVLLVPGHLACRLETEVPRACHCVQASCDDVELLRSVEATRRVSVLRARLLYLHSRRAVRISIGRDVLALDEHGTAITQHDSVVRLTIEVDQLEAFDIRISAEAATEVVLGDTSTHGDGEPCTLGDDLKNLCAGQLELLL